MLTKFFSMFSSVFSKNKMGMLLTMIFARAATAGIKEILDPDNQKKAYEFVKELNKRTDIGNAAKAKLFNLMMLMWAGKLGKKMTESVLNCLRELAVNAVKSECKTEEKKD